MGSSSEIYHQKKNILTTKQGIWADVKDGIAFKLLNKTMFLNDDALSSHGFGSLGSFVKGNTMVTNITLSDGSNIHIPVFESSHIVLINQRYKKIACRIISSF